MVKPFWQSKTFWVNVLVVVVTVLEATGVINAIPDDTALDQYAVLLLGVANLVLRAVTRQPISIR